jgi:hypothetical protein
VHAGLKTQLRAHDADRQAQVAGGADGHLVAAQKRAHARRGELPVVALRVDQAGGQRQVLRVLEYLVDAATRLDRAADRQFAVQLDPQLPRNGAPPACPSSRCMAGTATRGDSMMPPLERVAGNTSAR